MAISPDNRKIIMNSSSGQVSSLREYEKHEWEQFQAYTQGPSNDNLPGGRDTHGHASVQAWSYGDLFPAVIAQVEVYDEPRSMVSWAYDPQAHRFHGSYGDYYEAFFARSLAQRLQATYHDLIYPGQPTLRFACYSDAAMVARCRNAGLNDPVGVPVIPN